MQLRESPEQPAAVSWVTDAALRLAACFGAGLDDQTLDRVQVYERAMDMIFAFDRDGRLVDVNPAVERVLGYRRSELIGQHFRSVLPAEEIAQASERLRRKIVGVDWATVYESTLRHKQGREIGVMASTQTLPDRDGPAGVVAICREGVPEQHRLVECRSEPAGSGLTARQLEILQLLAQGRSTTQIAQDLFLSNTTVRNHIAHMLASLGVHTRLQAVIEASRAGLVPLAPQHTPHD